MDIKFKDGIKLGAAVYIGWSIAEAIDKALVKTEFSKKLFAKSLESEYRKNQQMNQGSKPDTDEPKARVIGFQMK